MDHEVCKDNLTDGALAADAVLLRVRLGINRATAQLWLMTGGHANLLHRFLEIRQPRSSLICMQVSHVTVHKDKIVRATEVLFVLLLFIGTGAAVKHITSSGVSKYITLDHEVRRILSKAERNNVRTAALEGARGGLRHLPQKAIGSPPSPEVLISDDSLLEAQLSWSADRILDLERSPVLNL